MASLLAGSIACSVFRFLRLENTRSSTAATVAMRIAPADPRMAASS